MKTEQATGRLQDVLMGCYTVPIPDGPEYSAHRDELENIELRIRTLIRRLEATERYLETKT